MLEAGSSGVDETVEALNAALTFDLVSINLKNGVMGRLVGGRVGRGG